MWLPYIFKIIRLWFCKKKKWYKRNHVCSTTFPPAEGLFSCLVQIFTTGAKRRCVMYTLLTLTHIFKVIWCWRCQKNGIIKSPQVFIMGQQWIFSGRLAFKTVFFFSSFIKLYKTVYLLTHKYDSTDLNIRNTFWKQIHPCWQTQGM